MEINLKTSYFSQIMLILLDNNWSNIFNTFHKN